MHAMLKAMPNECCLHMTMNKYVCTYNYVQITHIVQLVLCMCVHSGLSVVVWDEYKW